MHDKVEEEVRSNEESRGCKIEIFMFGFSTLLKFGETHRVDLAIE